MAKKGITAKQLIKGCEGISESEMISKCEEFLKDVEMKVVDEEGKLIKLPFGIVPTFSAFADYIGQSRADMHQWVAGHPTAGERMKAMVADTLAAGAMYKAYEPRIATFALKNWCGWEEAPQKSGSKRKEVASEKKAKEDLRAYIEAEEKVFKRNANGIAN